MLRLGRHRPLFLVALMLTIGFFHFFYFSSTDLHTHERPITQQPRPISNTNEQDTRPPFKSEPPAHRPLDTIHITRPRPVIAPKPQPTTPSSPPPPLQIPTDATVPESPYTPDFLNEGLSDGADNSKQSEPPKPHWKPSKEHYPIPPESIIPLPSGIPKALPRVQASFDTAERPAARKVRLERKEKVKVEFVHAWNGYKEKAFFHDEVRPVSGATHDPFGGWAATLVDTLDTLWIMGLTKEFEEAVSAVENLDFTTYNGGAIRVFETTIRYLGGLLGAYDISGAKYPALLKKAKELAEILYGVFDTPNRMPILSYAWEPEMVAIPQRAPTEAGAAELGSLSMEFIRLAQITKDNRYYDAVQRITDALDEYQNRTLIPGLWPHWIDTSGCGKKNPTSRKKQQLAPSAAEGNCVPQKLGRKPLFFSETYNQGAMIDSLYEYLIKNYILLGGLQEQYARMYKWSVQEAKKYLYFRPKVQGDKDILLAGQVQMKQVGQPGQDPATPFFEAHTSHLACFVGGMVGLGAQTLKLEGDLSVAKKLTDGCVWAYNVTTTGLMPEEFNVMKCPSEGVCKFSEEEWLREAFPYPFQSQKLDRLPPEVTALPPAPEDNPMVIANLKKQFDKRDGAGSEESSPLEMAQGQALAARRPPGMLGITDGRYILRPEAIESVFYMYRITGDTAWQDKGWNMFESAIKATKAKFGHSAISNVFAIESEISHDDSMESFWLAETLKYFYLLYSEPDIVSLDDYVFNTEAHPFKRPKA